MRDPVRIRVPFPFILKVERCVGAGISGCAIGVKMTDEELQERIDECCANMGYYPNKMKAAVNSFARHRGGPTETLAADMKVVVARSASMRSALTQSTLNMYARECGRFFEYLVQLTKS